MQIVAGDDDPVTVGKGLTVIVAEDVLTQPFPSVPVTLYIIVEVGAKLVLSVTLLSQVYDEAPPPFSFAFAPIQIVAGVGVAVTVGNV